ncbi:hypothetical protein [Micromonospora craniellae]|uniref:Uncharacterized protein n=1 Tax=Micromonospora craniellae TaxID=2294034 RepID=A0A372FUP5_9ACTN|nr:hypothetical protein [Micromonospora craniellae]QOC93839.1 hypothetical protein ID554_09535 [Micromonospora craniellae]RFS44334.1 hypothetical protein D0Q02_22955 [Micromonospora craniellae]
MRGLRRIVVVCLTALAVIGPVGPVHAAPADTPTAPAGSKYYVVGEPVAGQRESLYEIAARTLGTGRRHLEIFELTRGRPQPDGGQLTDPMVLKPGWILTLPADASGPGVYDEYPVATQAAPPPTRDLATPGRQGAPIFEAIGVFAAVMLFAVAVAVLRGGRGARQDTARQVNDPLPLSDPPSPSDVPPVHGHPGRSGLPPADADRELVLAGAHSSAPPVMDPYPATATSRTPHLPPTTPERPEWPTAPDRPTPPERPVRPSLGDRLRPVGPPSLELPRRTPTPSPPVPHLPESSAGRSRPEVGDAELSADLRAEGLDLSVSLNGARDAAAAPFGWYGPGEAPPAATLPLLLGDRDGWRLYVDLVRCPDVLTVAGSLPDGQRYARRLIRQALADGNEVTVVGDILGDSLPNGCNRAEQLSDVEPSPTPGIVVCARLANGDGRVARELRTAGVQVPVVLGEVTPSRWSISVRPTKEPGAELS